MNKKLLATLLLAMTTIWSAHATESEEAEGAVLNNEEAVVAQEEMTFPEVCEKYFEAITLFVATSPNNTDAEQAVEDAKAQLMRLETESDRILACEQGAHNLQIGRDNILNKQ